MNICFFGLFFDTFTPNTRTRFFSLNVNNLREFSLPLLANSSGTKSCDKKCRPRQLTNNESVLISVAGLARTTMLLHRFLLVIWRGPGRTYFADNFALRNFIGEICS